MSCRKYRNIMAACFVVVVVVVCFFVQAQLLFRMIHKSENITSRTVRWVDSNQNSGWLLSTWKFKRNQKGHGSF